MAINFTGSNLFTVLLLFAAGLVFIIKGGDWFVDAATWIAEAFGIPKFIVGATVVSFATTLPEMLVSVFAALEGNADIAVGNAVGSVTANTGLIMCLSLVCLPDDAQAVRLQGLASSGDDRRAVCVHAQRPALRRAERRHPALLRRVPHGKSDGRQARARHGERGKPPADDRQGAGAQPARLCARRGDHRARRAAPDRQRLRAGKDDRRAGFHHRRR